MSIETIKLIIAVIAAALGAVSLLLVWIFAIEAKKNVAVLPYSDYKRFVNSTYTFFVLISVVVWFTSTSTDQLLVWAYLCSAVLWPVTGVAVFVISIAARDRDSKEKMRSTLFSCLGKTFISALILLFIA